jgi:hypothetical protein
MTGLEIALTALATIVFSWAMYLWYQWNKWMEAYIDVADKYISEVRLTKMYQKELAATKAELELYKNHQETAKVFTPFGKCITVSTKGAGVGKKAAFDVFGIDLVNGVQYTFWYKGKRYLGYEAEGSILLAHPLNHEADTEAGENIGAFLEF